ncbi:MAG TPA: hypothetical protein PKC22_09945 [Rhodocyclaceae bacterium]|nr:hypothetical protein [Rhodocyclaceae bacterium]
MGDVLHRFRGLLSMRRSSAFGCLPRHFLSQPFFLRPQLGGELRAEILGFEDLTDLDVRITY